MKPQRPRPMPRHRNAASIARTAALAAALLPALVWAQAIELPGDADVSRLRAEPLPLPATPKFDLRIESPEKSPVPKAVDEILFEVQDIVVEGASRYPEEEVKALFRPLMGNKVGLSAVREAAEALEARYRRDGYFLVRVFVPPQQVKDGVFRIRVVEGFIENVQVEGGSAGARELVERVVRPVAGKRPVDLGSLEQALLVLNDLPGVVGSGVLRQGGSLGASDLVVTLSEPPARTVTATTSNTLSKTLGEVSIGLNAIFNNPFERWPGQLLVGFSGTPDFERLKALNARYATGVGDRGTVLSLGALVANARPTGSLAPLDIESNSWSLSPRARTPLLRSRGLSIFVEGGLTLNEARTTSDSTVLAHDRALVADAALFVSDKGRWSGNTDVAITLARGVDAGIALPTSATTASVRGAELDFTKLKLNFSRWQELPADFSLQVSMAGQWTEDKLLSGERVSFGGVAIGRAYDSGAASGDRGAGALLELRRDIRHPSIALTSGGKLQAYLFADYAYATLLANPVAGSAESSKYMHSLGAGLRYQDSKALSLDLMIASARNTIKSSDPRHDPRVLLMLSKGF